MSPKKNLILLNTSFEAVGATKKMPHNAITNANGINVIIQSILVAFLIFEIILYSILLLKKSTSQPIASLPC